MCPSEFTKQFPNADWGVIPWNKGQTKETHRSLAKLSYNLKLQKEWNFSKWQRKWRKQKKNQYRKFIRDKNLAELIGMVLGDGNLYRHERTEQLRIVCNSNDNGFVQHIVNLIKKIFSKNPTVFKRKRQNAINITLYQCKISERLDLPAGDKIKNNVGVPLWIKANKKFSIYCLKGLFETDGCFVVDKDNYTQIIEFKNNCRRLREDVYSMLSKLDYHPQFGKNYIRLARREEVLNFKELINFRNY